jgi:hypothetical protein
MPLRVSDWHDAAKLEAAALAEANGATGFPDDPPEFRAWLGVLRKPEIRSDEREAIYDAMYDYFDWPQKVSARD